jgi:peroxiredoxin
MPPDHKYAGYPQRVSYLIDGAGIIRAAYEVKDLAGHSAEVLADLASMS